MNLRVGLDLDGVVANFVAGMRDWLNGKGMGTGEMPDPDTWAIWEAWGYSREEWEEQFAQAVAQGLFHKLFPYKGAVEAIHRLKEAGHTIHVITHRSDPAAQTSTVGWLHVYGIPYDTLTFARDKSGYPVDVMIEDHVDNARAVEASGVPCYVLDRPWNRNADDVRRVANWDEFFSEVSNIAAGKPTATRPPARAVGEVRVTSPTGGTKGSKPERFSMLPVEALEEVARVYGYGAEKYTNAETGESGRDNWRKGYDFSLSYDALQRHVNSFWKGETMDPESGLQHLGHAGFHILTLMTFVSQEKYSDYDDRQVKPA